jgi:hypothetical protein
MSPDHLLNLSWEIQAALASGYVAYAIAYTGLRDRQRPIDIAFISLAFSLIASAMLWLLGSFGPILASVAAFLAAVVAGIIWRKFGRPFIFPVLRALNITWSNDDPSALVTITDKHAYITQIAVLLDDGTWLRCDDVRKFEGAPFWPCIIGPNGDVGLYLTHEESAKEEAKLLTTVRDPYYGDLLTWVPATRIKQINIRHNQSNYSSKEAAAEDSERLARPGPSVAQKSPDLI